MRVLVAGAENTERFWKKLIANLPSDLEIAMTPLWRSGTPTVADAVLSHGLHDGIRDFSPDLLIADLPLTQAFHVDLLKVVRKKRVGLGFYLRGDLWAEVRADPRFLVRAAGVSLVRSQLRRADFILAICKWLERRIQKEIGRGPNTSVVYQGVDPNQFYRDKPEPLEHPNVGILQTHNVLPKASALANFHHVVNKMPEVHFYVVAGEPEPDVGRATYFPMVKKALSGLRNVHFVKQLSHPDGVRRFLSSCDIYALVSGLDCCPTTLLEASLTETPVIASRVGGVPELVLDGKTGFCLLNSFTEEWVRTIRELHRNPERARKIGREARTFVSEKFNWARIAQDFADAVKSSYAT